jgi:hypothetical protein
MGASGGGNCNPPIPKPFSAGEIVQLLEQRKMLLGVVLQATKGAAAQKVR